MSVAPTHQGADRMQKKKKKKRKKVGGEGEDGKKTGSGDKEKIRRGFRGEGGEKGGKKRGARKKKTHGSILKTRLYTRVRPIQKVGASKVKRKKRKKKKRDRMSEEQRKRRRRRRRGYPRVTKDRKQKERGTDKHLCMGGENEREGRQRAET